MQYSNFSHLTFNELIAYIVEHNISDEATLRRERPNRASLLNILLEWDDAETARTIDTMDLSITIREFHYDIVHWFELEENVAVYLWNWAQLIDRMSEAFPATMRVTRSIDRALAAQRDWNNRVRNEVRHNSLKTQVRRVAQRTLQEIVSSADALI